MAKAAQAKGKTSPRKGKRKGGAPKPWVKALVLIMLFPFAALLLPTTLVFVTMMAPTMIAYITDRSREKHLAITVGLLNIAGTLPAIIELWSRGQSHAAAMDLITDVYTWFIAYGAASAGWMIFGFMPSLVGIYFRMTTQTRIMGLVRRQKALIKEWGHAVADGTSMPLPTDDEDDEAEDGAAAEDVDVTEAELVEPAPSH